MVSCYDSESMHFKTVEGALLGKKKCVKNCEKATDLHSSPSILIHRRGSRFSAIYTLDSEMGEKELENQGLDNCHKFRLSCVNPAVL